jgi:hypothetical protein
LNLFRAISNILRFDRTNWKALALCFFAAGIFWIFNALNKNYATNIRFPLRFEYDAVNYIAVDPLPGTLTLNVSGNGWELLRKSLSIKSPGIILPLERPAETHKIVASALSPIVASQLETMQINFIVTDTLRLKIEPKLKRKIRMVANLSNITFKEDFGRTSPVVILPDSVSLEGPKSQIESLHDTIFLNVIASNISGNFREPVEIYLNKAELIRRSPPVAEIIFEVGPIEILIHSVKVNVPKLLHTASGKDSVQCVFRIPQKEHGRFLTELPSLTATFSSITLNKGDSKAFLPELEGVPSYAEVVQIDSVVIRKP